MKKESVNNRFSPLRESRFKFLLLLAVILIIVFIILIVTGYYGAKKGVSYLPEIHDEYLESYSVTGNEVTLGNQWYLVKADEAGRVGIETREGEIIVSALTYYAAYQGNDEKWGLTNISVQLSSDSTISIQGEGLSNTLVNILFTVHKKSQKLDIHIKTNYSLSTDVLREALVAKLDVPVSDVFLKNGKTEIENFNTEYWLHKQGVRFGSGLRSSLIYNTQDISSLQLNAEKRLLFINLDYYLDHPYIQIPFQKDGSGNWTDLSSAKFEAGSERNNYFSIYFGNLPRIIPRLMLVPEGYLAGYVFTEHADGGNIETHRAAYYGAEDISDVKDATGGFVGHRIPVTLSVFYADSTGNLPGSSIRDDPDKPVLLDFLDKIYSTGLYDICLHTPEPYNSNRETLVESIKFMKERFNASSWIDHGMYSGNSNRESFVCDGLNPGSEYYAADLWETFGTRYFWNTAKEYPLVPSPSIKKDIRELRFKEVSTELWRRYLYQKVYKGLSSYDAFIATLKGYVPRNELNTLQPFKGQSYPTPLYWRNITRTEQFYSWATDYNQDYEGFSTDDAEYQLRYEENQLNKLLTDWGIFIGHAYFSRRIKGRDILSEENGKVVINPYFDKYLGIMERMRDRGDLYITTISDLLDYWVLLENVTFEYLPDGSIEVFNANDKQINGLSLAFRADSVQINGEVPSFKRIMNNTIVWFDLPAGGCVKVKVVK